MNLAKVPLLKWMIVIFSLLELAWPSSLPSGLKSLEVENSDDPFEIVSIGRDWTKERGDWDLEFEAFDRNIKIRLSQNKHLTTPTLRVVEKSSFSNRVINPQRLRNCHWLGKDGQNILASISDCTEKELTGIVLMEDGILEIQPLTDPIQRALMAENDRKENLHIIRQTITIPPIPSEITKNLPLSPNLKKMTDRKLGRTSNQRLTLEVALFFDQAGYESFTPLYGHDPEKIKNVLLAYINGVQALFHHPSLGEPIDIVPVHLEIMRQQPIDLPTHDGEQGALLYSFCEYQSRRNPQAGQKGHWDVGIYLTGLDLFSWTKHLQKFFQTLGKARLARVCSTKDNCLLTEFGSGFQGFLSVYVLAHEIGHTLGMRHDSEGNATRCPKNGFIMSPIRHKKGETTWSECSREAISDLRTRAQCLLDRPREVKPEYDAMSRFKGRPGQVYTAKKQCEILLNDLGAIPLLSNGLHTICQSLTCESSQHRLHYAGPALEGTSCGYLKSCTGGDCL